MKTGSEFANKIVAGAWAKTQTEVGSQVESPTGEKADGEWKESWGYVLKQFEIGNLHSSLTL